MPKEKPPRFPVGLTVDEALQRGWRPGLGRPLIAGDDEIIREVMPGDGWIATQPRRRRRSRSSDSPRARIKAVMERWCAAERERKRKRYKKTATRALPEKNESSGIPLRERIGFKNRTGRQASMRWGSRIQRICVSG